MRRHMRPVRDPQNAKGEDRRRHDQDSVHPEERRRTAVPVLAGPRAIVAADRQRKPWPDDDVEQAGGHQKQALNPCDHHPIMEDAA